MAFGEQAWDVLFPSYLTSMEKTRLKCALQQFFPSGQREISYLDFYRKCDFDYFLQGDIILDVRTAIWNKFNNTYDKFYIDALILSNTCDISFDNHRVVNSKQCLFAPLLILDDYLGELITAGQSQSQVEGFKRDVIAQHLSNIFYLPAFGDGEKERIALLDQIFWYPIDELALLVETINEDRLLSLSNFGFYLLAFKLSYHFCRLPEGPDRSGVSHPIQ